MKKSIYKYYNSKMLIVNNIMVIIGVIALLISIIAVIQNIENIKVTIFIMAIMIILILITNKRSQDIKKYNQTKEKGIKIPAVIKEIIMKEDSTEYGISKSYFLLIKYIDPNTNQEVEFKTDELAINPYNKLKSYNCNVYIYGDNRIAEDFELNV